MKDFLIISPPFYILKKALACVLLTIKVRAAFL